MSWTHDKLNAYISYLVESSEQQGTTLANVPTGNGQIAWLAAAEIVEDEYPYRIIHVGSGVCRECILTEGDSWGLFQTKNKITSQYNSYVKQLKAGTATNGKLMTFESNEDSDLAYSLYSCAAYYIKTGDGNLTTYDWYIYDIYDFAWDGEYSSPFISLVNNAAYLSQQKGALNMIDVYIYFNPVVVL